MKKTEHLRQTISGLPGLTHIQQQIEQGWKMVAIEWEREVEEAEGGVSSGPGPQGKIPVEVPFGLHVSADTQRLEESPEERELLFLMMELIVQEGSYARIADEINRRGYRTRQGGPWTPVSVFEMLPRLIEVGPHVFHSEEWQKRRQQFATR
jgi:hypothetical protein